jgi:hypothetical protein
MPFYLYQCVDCNGFDQRVAGLDDHTAICADCGSLMLRADQDVFQAYSEPESDPDLMVPPAVMASGYWS